MTPPWTYYEVGQIVSSAGVEILQVVATGKLQSETAYRVRYLCCGEDEEISHSRLRKRERSGYVRCTHCRAKGVVAKKPAVIQATWPAPPTALTTKVY